MKKLLIVLFLLAGTLYSQSPGNWSTYTFSAGDTTTTFAVASAQTVLFVIADSSMAGTDTIAIYFQSPSATTNTLYSVVAVHDLAQTTSTTNTTTIYSGDGVTKTFVYTAAIHGAPISGTFFIRRLNTRTGEAVYAPKTRLAFRYDK